MSKLVKQAENQLKEIIISAVNSAVAAGELPDQPIPPFGIEIPAERAHGDLSSNAALVSARAFRLPPRKIADILINRISLDGTLFESAGVAGPGFLNFRLSPAFYAGVVSDILEQGENYGRSDFGKGRKVMVEFVSANPTGPMHMGNARGGALGDCLASVLEAAGYDVWREFYVNDAGNQIENFGISLEARYLQLFKGEDAVRLPDDAYHGEDIIEHARGFAAIYGDKYLNADPQERRQALINYALPLNIEKMRRDLKKYRIEYDCWFYESALHKNGELDETIRILSERGLTYQKEGALWYRASEYGGEKDEVLVRANGNPTYFAADIAYHRNKFARGFDLCINVWGTDHHGHVARMKGAMDAIGLDGSKLEVVLIQLVRLMRGGEVVRMSKRTGKAIQLSDLLDEVPVDAARFFFNQREASTQMDFDLELAVEESAQNPVYYVQYAHARICSIFRNLETEGIAPKNVSADDLLVLTHPDEKELIRHLAGYTGEIIEAAKSFEPARITRYCLELASLFHKFYNSCRVKCEDEKLMAARLALCAAARHTLRNALALLKINAPESM
ncbi:MAG TPA: arginine--tRNA ligase [Candidatus Avimonas sp.]|jgi:arginyl-tRNA synthetase|nr:arginine--tRNA ligase [Clostridiales bacterium]HOB36568.1 arginine--tRNA ligase [Candidatus Avimonas sp.]HQA16033.1 arginine--tRNA ligase [Candidatus Avimonas sp.]HQD37995.1 arginine--tRNA ligase [Candidatus Avimonas sp.]